MLMIPPSSLLKSTAQQKRSQATHQDDHYPCVLRLPNRFPGIWDFAQTQQVTCDVRPPVSSATDAVAAQNT